MFFFPINFFGIVSGEFGKTVIIATRRDKENEAVSSRRVETSEEERRVCISMV